MERDDAHGLLPVNDPSALPTFDVALRGYDRRQVSEYLDRIERDLAITQADRTAAVSHARAMEQRLAELQKELHAERERLVESEQPTYAGLGAKAEMILRLAEEEAARLRSEAERDVAGVRAGAETILQGAADKAAEVERNLDAMMAARRQQAEDEQAAQHAEREQRMAAAERQIADAEALVEQRTTEARAEAGRILGGAEQHGTAVIQAARSEAEQLLAQARAEAERIVAAGRSAVDEERATREKEITALVRRRTDISRQLKSLRQVLGSLPDAEDEADQTDTTLQLVRPPPAAPRE
ncbi:MAG: DivIVA domain-containing protein [Pseudonocardiales bacterium]